MFPLTYCKDIANLLFWVLYACLSTHTQSDTINLETTFQSIFNFIPHVFTYLRSFININEAYSKFIQKLTAVTDEIALCKN